VVTSTEVIGDFSAKPGCTNAGNSLRRAEGEPDERYNGWVMLLRMRQSGRCC
jgi:hypothetical protein